jgi:uncharacterized protein YdeI (YjbR/CyaY-like superfamily)
MVKKEVGIFYPKNTEEWRIWLEINHASLNEVWVVFYKKGSGHPTISWSESVDQALCFGWIDSKKIAVDEVKAHQYFCKRKTKSSWSRINKEKVERLISQGLMTQAGYKSIEIAKLNGAWTLMDEVDALIIPKDLEVFFEKNHTPKDHYFSLSNSNKKILLQKLVLAKLPNTRKKYMEEFAEISKQSAKKI